MAQNENTYHKRTKHIDIKAHFIKDPIKANVIKLEYMPSAEMEADILTNGLPIPKHLLIKEDWFMLLKI